MKSLPLFILFLFVGMLSNICNGQASILMEQTFFDSDTCCWRKLNADKKYLDAANLIVSYLDTSMPNNKHSLHWHAGQMFAMAKSDKLAKNYFKKTYSVFYKWFGDTDARTWYYYAKGTVAFIDNDKKSLERIIKHWSNKFPIDINYKVLVQLNGNWSRGYELASTKD